MKKLIGLVLISLITINLSLFSGNVAAADLEKITICHFTGSTTNPFVKITVSSNAEDGHFNLNGTPRAGHLDDLLFKGDVDCPRELPKRSELLPSGMISSNTNSNSSTVNQVHNSTISQKQGEVLGVNKLADTGDFVQKLATILQIVGLLLVAAGVSIYARLEIEK